MKPPVPGQAQSRPAALWCRVWALGLCLTLLAGCGGGSDVWWCISSGSGSVSAGFNTSDCPPQVEDD